MEKHATEQAPRNGWRPGFYMKPKHIGLVCCVSLVGCMVAFGGGFIVGMGYKASEQVSPYAVKRTPTVQFAGQQNGPGAAWQEESLTFYDALIRPVETIQAPAVPTPAAPPRTPTPAPSAQSVAAQETQLEPPATGQGTTAIEAAQAPSASPAAPSVPVPAIQPAIAEGTGLDPLAVDLASVSSPGTAPSGVGMYSVQVASFLTPERAERLIEELTRKGYRAYVHPFEVPGQPSWYRVKVGKFADRAAANLALQQLGTPDAMITRD